MYTGLPQKSQNLIPGLFKVIFQDFLKESPFFRLLQVTGLVVSLFCPGKARVKLSNTVKDSKQNLRTFQDLKQNSWTFQDSKKNPGLFQDVATLCIPNYLVFSEVFTAKRLK